MTSNSTSRYLSKENENTNHKDIYTLMFIATLFTTAKIWKQPNCPSTEEWTKKMWFRYTVEYSVQFSSATQLCPTLCNPMDCSMPGHPVHHQLPEFILKLMSIESVMPSNHLILCCPLLLLPPNPSQHQGLFQWVSSLHPVAKVLEFQLQHRSFQWILRTDLL